MTATMVGPYRNRMPAFTLIDTLVLVGALSVLLLLALPALSLIHGDGRMVGCMSNQHQIGYAASQYMIDFQGAMPPPVIKPGDDASIKPEDWVSGVPGRYGGRFTWGAFLNRYVGNVDAWVDPAMAHAMVQARGEPDQEANPEYWSLPFWHYNYGLNGYVYRGSKPYLRADLLLQPAATSRMFCYGGFAGGGSRRLHSSGQFGYFPGMYAQATAAQPHAFIQGDSIHHHDAVRGRHPNLSINVLFHDGHVEGREVQTVHDPDRAAADHGRGAGAIVDEAFWGIGVEEQSPAW
jgi:prepilin-type processing-associated H-X9-DG protein